MKYYLDWNIFVEYRDYKFKQKEKYLKEFKYLDNLLTNGDIEFFYTASHLWDIINLKKEDKKEYHENDMYAISLLTSNKYVYYYMNKFVKDIVNPSMQFKHLEEKGLLTSKEDLIKSDEYNLWGKYLIDDPVKRVDQNNQWIINSKQYRKERSVEILEKAERELVLKIKHDLENDSYDSFIKYVSTIPIVDSRTPLGLQTTYSVFDFLNFCSDKNFKSMSIDAEHVSNAGFLSDYLVTEDLKMSKKARFLYEIYNFKTEVINLTQFFKLL